MPVPCSVIRSCATSTMSCAALCPTPQLRQVAHATAWSPRRRMSALRPCHPGGRGSWMRPRASS
eukprot:10217736-Alexandrium_andersonii.AAC.1